MPQPMELRRENSPPVSWRHPQQAPSRADLPPSRMATGTETNLCTLGSGHTGSICSVHPYWAFWLLWFVFLFDAGTRTRCFASTRQSHSVNSLALTSQGSAFPGSEGWAPSLEERRELSRSSFWTWFLPKWSLHWKYPWISVVPDIVCPVFLVGFVAPAAELVNTKTGRNHQRCDLWEMETQLCSSVNHSVAGTLARGAVFRKDTMPWSAVWKRKWENPQDKQRIPADTWHLGRGPGKPWRCAEPATGMLLIVGCPSHCHAFLSARSKL